MWKKVAQWFVTDGKVAVVVIGAVIVGGYAGLRAIRHLPDQSYGLLLDYLMLGLLWFGAVFGLLDCVKSHAFNLQAWWPGERMAIGLASGLLWLQWLGSAVGRVNPPCMIGGWRGSRGLTERRSSSRLLR